jgi:hypothetical protein
MEPIDETAIISDNPQTPREKFEQARLSRRAALRKIGVTSGMAFFGLFAVDDLARLAIKKMEENKQTREIGETVAKEFKTAGIAFADDNGGTDNCSKNYPAGSSRDDCNQGVNNTLKSCLSDNKCPT